MSFDSAADIRSSRIAPQPVVSCSKKHLPLRIEPAVWAGIELLAAQGLRSLNALVEFQLREASARRGRKLPPPEPPRQGKATGD